MTAPATAVGRRQRLESATRTRPRERPQQRRSRHLRQQPPSQREQLSRRSPVRSRRRQEQAANRQVVGTATRRREGGGEPSQSEALPLAAPWQRTRQADAARIVAPDQPTRKRLEAGGSSEGRLLRSGPRIPAAVKPQDRVEQRDEFLGAAVAVVDGGAAVDVAAPAQEHDTPGVRPIGQLDVPAVPQDLPGLLEVVPVDAGKTGGPEVVRFGKVGQGLGLGILPVSSLLGIWGRGGHAPRPAGSAGAVGDALL